jgi:5-methyltetrahydrofolate--homocysteine methyltransferase
MDEREQEILDALRDGIVNIDLAKVRRACEDVLTEKIPPVRAINYGMMRGMQTVGEKFQTGEYFLTELIAAGAAMDEGLKILEPHLQKDESRKVGTIVLGTVEGDLHSIGKDIVRMLLRSAGFEVIDLGVDVPTQKFIEAARVGKPGILGMSALITPTMPEMKNVIAQLQRDGLRAGLKIIVGGAPVTEEYAQTIGADAYGSDAIAGVNICKEWVTRSAQQ